MSGRDVGADGKRAGEEEYFRKKNQELIEGMRRQAEAEQERRRMAEASGIFNDAILRELQALGYGPETVTLLELVPLIYAAWAEGDISRAQRDLIIDAAILQGVVADGTVSDQLSAWLADRPPYEFFQASLRALRARLEGLPPGARGDTRRRLLDECSLVAAASGGFLGLGSKISSEERLVLEQISAALAVAGPGDTGA